jgi:hypothetical protein
MVNLFSGCGFAWAANAAPFSFCAPAVIADSAIAAWPAVSKRAFINAGKRTAATSKARKDALIIATGNASTVTAGPSRRNRPA